ELHAASDVDLRGTQQAVAGDQGGAGVVGVDDDRAASLGEGPVALAVERGLVVVVEDEHAGGDVGPGPVGDGAGANGQRGRVPDGAEAALQLVLDDHLDVAGLAHVGPRGGRDVYRDGVRAVAVAV